MIYRSNLTAPSITGFCLCPRVKQIMGHDAPSDPHFEPNCTYWTHDEGAILYACAQSRPGLWLDIGARFGWTAAHLVAAGCKVDILDPHFNFQAETERMEVNMRDYWHGVENVIAKDADNYFAGLTWESRWDGFVIDGNHDSPFPMHDAQSAHMHAKPRTLILFHDFWGRPIQEGVEWLMRRGWACRVYNTPNGVAACWLNQWDPPEHVPDAEINWKDVRRARAPEFDFSRCR